MSVQSEKETRKNLIGWARKYGADADLMKLFARYDELLKHCKSNEERKSIQTMAIMEINKFFGMDKFTKIKFKDGSSIVLDENNREMKL